VADNGDVVLRVYHLVAIGLAAAVFVGGVLVGRSALAREAEPADVAPPAPSATVTVNEIVVSSPNETVTLEQSELQAEFEAANERASDRTAEAAVRDTIPAAEAYYADRGSYEGMSVRELREIDAGIGPGVRVGYATVVTYCIEAFADAVDADPRVAHYRGPGGSVLEGPCPPA
jgi:hypothetical protein